MTPSKKSYLIVVRPVLETQHVGCLFMLFLVLTYTAVQHNFISSDVHDN